MLDDVYNALVKKLDIDDPLVFRRLDEEKVNLRGSCIDCLANLRW